MGSIRVVVDNKAAAGFVVELGFAPWIEAAGRTILFDTVKRSDSIANRNMIHGYCLPINNRSDYCHFGPNPQSDAH
jgi:hypothetical protein